MSKLFETSIELGQVWTPEPVATHMARLLLDREYFGGVHGVGEVDGAMRVLDPCVGPGTFLKPLFAASKASGTPLEIDAVDIDGGLLARTASAFADTPVKFIKSDYLEFSGGDYDAIILNPPYVRHELIGQNAKDRYRELLRSRRMTVPSARSNLYAYFILKAISQLLPGGRMCAIVHGNLHTTAYGQELWRTVERHMTVLHTERLEVPFEGASIDAEIFLAEKREVPVLRRGFDGEALEIGVGSVPPGFARIGELLDVSRGTDLVNRRRFVRRGLPEVRDSTIPLVLRTPPRGQLLVEANASIVSDPVQGVLSPTRFRSARVIFNYYLRHSPRHLWNVSGATVSDNFLLLRSSELSEETLWLIMNSTIVADEIMRAAKPQGSGLRKLQVYQYREVAVPDWRLFSAEAIAEFSICARKLLASRAEQAYVRETADELLKGAFG